MFYSSEGSRRVSDIQLEKAAWRQDKTSKSEEGREMRNVMLEVCGKEKS
jgi:hypothetical protein